MNSLPIVPDSAKTEVQLTALTTWQERGCKGTLEMATGSGKTKCGIDAAAGLIWKMVEHNLKPKVLIITPTEELRDREWVKEATKWEANFLFEDGLLDIVCIQTCYKWTNQIYDLVVVDEIDLTLSPEYIKFYSQNTCKRILGLTATVPDDKKALLETIAPIVYTITTSEARGKELVSDYKVYNVAVEFNEAEKRQYKIHNENIEKASKEIALSPNDNIFMRAKGLIGYAKGDQSKRRWAFVYMQAVRDRTALLYNCNDKLKVTKQLIDQAKPKKCIVFSQTIDFAEKMASELKSLVYHSKLDKVRRELNLSWFNDTESIYTTISTVMALDRGINVESTEMCIIASGTQKPHQLTQRLGRGLRKTEENITTICVNLYVKDTKEMDWVARRCENETPIWIPSVEAFLQILKPFH